MSKRKLLDRVRELVGDVTRARFTGGPYAKLARAHGYADGYMRALLDAGLVDQRELIAAVGAERERVVQEDVPVTSAA